MTKLELSASLAADLQRFLSAGKEIEALPSHCPPTRDLAAKPTIREIAAATGRQTYNGPQCHRCQSHLRYTSSRACVLCQRRRMEQAREAAKA